MKENPTSWLDRNDDDGIVRERINEHTAYILCFIRTAAAAATDGI